MAPSMHGPLALLVLSSAVSAVYATMDYVNGTHGTRHLVETNRFEFLRGRIEYYLTEATKKQYNGNTVQTSPEASCSNAHGGNYVENKQIARDIRENLQQYSYEAFERDQISWLRALELDGEEEVGFIWNVAVSDWDPPSGPQPSIVGPLPVVPGTANGMSTNRPCDKPVVPDGCADTGGLVSVQLGISVGGDRPQAVVYKNAVVLISRRNEALFPQSFFHVSSKELALCIRLLVEAQDVWGMAALIDLTQVADCLSNSLLEQLGKRPRGVFISRTQFASLSTVSAACRGSKKHIAAKVDSPAQSFSSGHIVANVAMRYAFSLGPGQRKDSMLFFYVVLPPAGQSSLPAELPPEHPRKRKRSPPPPP